MLLPGYSHLDRSDDFESGDPALSLNWETWSGDVSTGSLEEGRFRIHIEGNTITYTNPTDDLAWSDLYLQADVRVGDTPSFYEYGLAVRLNADNNEFYSLRFSSDNDWAADAYQGDWIRLQEWTVSPLIDLSDPNPTIGIYVHGDTLRLYFDHQFLGEVTDPQKMFSSGTVGLMAGTSTDQTDAVTVYFDNVVITTPAQAGGNVLSNGLTSIFGSATPIAGIQPSPTQSLGLPFGTPGATNTPKPTQTPTWTPQPPPAEGLVNWNSSSPAKIVSELQQAGVVPKGGDVSMTVPTTFGDTSDIGFSFYPLGQGRAFRNFVLGFDEHLDITGPGSGCGMFFRSSDTSSSDVLIFEDGTFLLGQFDSSGSLTANSVVDISPAVLTGRGAVNRVVVVAVEKEMRLYVNGELVAQGSSFMAGSGTLALEMYVNSDDVGNTQRTYCQLDNVWLWEF
jgi:hypothetical protein